MKHKLLTITILYLCICASLVVSDDDDDDDNEEEEGEEEEEEDESAEEVKNIHSLFRPNFKTLVLLYCYHFLRFTRKHTRAHAPFTHSQSKSGACTFLLG